MLLPAHLPCVEGVSEGVRHGLAPSAFLGRGHQAQWAWVAEKMGNERKSGRGAWAIVEACRLRGIGLWARPARVLA